MRLHIYLFYMRLHIKGVTQAHIQLQPLCFTHLGDLFRVRLMVPSSRSSPGGSLE